MLRVLLVVAAAGLAMQAEAARLPRLKRKDLVPSLPTLDLKAFLKSAQDLFPRTARARGDLEAIQAAQANAGVAMRESPFTLSSQFQKHFTEADPQLTPGQTGTIFGLTFLNNLTYQDRFGFSVSLSANTSFGTPLLPVEVNSNAVEAQGPYTLGLIVGYDVLRGGGSGLGKSQEAEAVMSAMQTKFNSDGALLADRVEFISLMIDSYFSQCKIQVTRSGQEQVDEAVHEGKLEYQTGNLGYTDYLNYVDLENSFSKLLVQQTSARDSFLELAVSWSPETRAVVENLGHLELACAPAVDEVEKTVSSVRIDPGNEKLVAEAIPASRAAVSARDSAAAGVRVAKLSNLPSISPFVSGDLFKLEDFQDGGLKDAAVGISVQWNIPGPRGGYAVDAAQRQEESAEAIVQSAYQGNVSLLRRLQADIRNQKSTISIYSDSIAVLRKLLHAIEVKRAIGEADTLNYTISFLNEVNSETGMIDAWDSLEKSAFQSGVYLDYAKIKAHP